MPAKNKKGSTSKNPKPGQFVKDKHDGKKKKVHSKQGTLYFIGADHEPVRRNEFTFPIPKSKSKPKPKSGQDNRGFLHWFFN